MNRIFAEQNLKKIAEVSLILTAGACLALWIARIFYAISFVTPYMAATTGSEEECLFSIWKLIQHQSVYADPHRIPFAVSFYNWGFYWFYGPATKACLRLFQLDAVWIATVGRLITLGFALIAGAVFYVAQLRFVKGGLFAHTAVRWAWCAIATCSPLVGFWSITVRPDIGALAFECAGLYAILVYLENPRYRLVAAAAVLFYLAWAFKQSQVTMLAGSALSLLILKRWRAFFLLGGAWWLLVIVTILVGGPVYRESTLFAEASLPWIAILGMKNFGLAIAKNPFLPYGMAMTLWIVFRQRNRLALKPAATLISVTLLFSFCFAAATAFKYGAEANYYIPAAWLAMLAFAVQSEQIHARGTLAGLALCSLLLMCGFAWAHIGSRGYRHDDAVHRIVAEKLKPLPGPVFLTDPYANLPWVQPLSPHFVVASTWGFYPRAPLEDGGWEGLLRDGYFGTVVNHYGDDLPSSLLARYQLVDEYKDAQTDYKFYRRVVP